MIVKSKIEGLREWLFIEDIPDAFAPGNTISEKKVTIERSPLRMENYQLNTGGLFLMYSDMVFSETVRVHTEIVGETVTSQFIAFRQPQKKGPAYGGSRHNIRFIPSCSHSYELKPGVEYTYFLMVISKQYYYRLIDRHSSLHEDFAQEIDRGVAASYAPQDLPITTDMQRIIQELRETRKTGELRRLHTEAKVLELLIHQIEQFNEVQPEEQRLFPDEDIEKLERARRILEERFADPPTQRELAMEVMLNETKLRRGFKDYFATTIYDYITRLRMEAAKGMLLDEHRSIYETALLTGFRHQPNFSIAFKRYFGISPSDIQQSSPSN